MKNNSQKLAMILSITYAVALLLGLLFLWENDSLTVSEYTLNQKIPEAFDGFKIVQVSDLHCHYFGKRLAAAVHESTPDIIVLTGDLVDRKSGNPETAYQFIRDISGVASIYAVSGNHEKSKVGFEAHQKKLAALGVVLLENQEVTLCKNGASIGLFGIEDPYLPERQTKEEVEGLVREQINRFHPVYDYNIMLFHRANMMELFDDSQFDLVFSGHLHGGQIRLPWLGGLFSPAGEIFPKHSEGMYVKGKQTYVISRGLGNLTIVPRINNKPELVVVTLQSTTADF